MDQTEIMRPELGSAEAGVLGLVNLMSFSLGVDEALLSYWLDSYYQLRLQYERENSPEPDPTILHRSDLEAVLRQLWEETLHKSCRKEAAKRMDDRHPTGEPDAIIFKRMQKERLEELRSLGLHIAQIEEASDGALTDHQILSILEGSKQPLAIYRVLCSTLDKLEPLFRGRSEE